MTGVHTEVPDCFHPAKSYHMREGIWDHGIAICGENGMLCVKTHSSPSASSMTSAFFLGAFVTAHFLMPCSSIHWIHSLSPFTMGRPLSTAQQTHGVKIHSRQRAFCMASAFFLGAFVTAHFLILCSPIHRIHSLSPFAMGRPFSEMAHTPKCVINLQHRTRHAVCDLTAAAALQQPSCGLPVRNKDR